MLALKDLYSRQPITTHDTAYALMHPTKKSAAGVITLLLVALGIYFMLPEIRRYIHLERM